MINVKTGNVIRRTNNLRIYGNVIKYQNKNKMSRLAMD